MGRSAVLASFEGLRLDARTLFEWAKADLWTAIARMAVLEANRTTEALEGSTVLPDPGRTVVSPGGTRVEGEALAQVAEELAIRELTRLLALARKTPVRTLRGTSEAPFPRRVVRSARRLRSRVVPRPA